MAVKWEDHQNVSAECLQRYRGGDICLKCEGWGWRFPRSPRPWLPPTIDGVVFYQAQPCAECSGGRCCPHTFERLGWGGVR